MGVGGRLFWRPVVHWPSVVVCARGCGVVVVGVFLEVIPHAGQLEVFLGFSRCVVGQPHPRHLYVLLEETETAHAVYGVPTLHCAVVVNALPCVLQVLDNVTFGQGLDQNFVTNKTSVRVGSWVFSPVLEHRLSGCKLGVAYRAGGFAVCVGLLDFMSHVVLRPVSFPFEDSCAGCIFTLQVSLLSGFCEGSSLGAFCPRLLAALGRLCRCKLG